MCRLRNPKVHVRMSAIEKVPEPPPNYPAAYTCIEFTRRSTWVII
jgi:hypothetical protein